MSIKPDPLATTEAKLPRRDWIILPILSLTTIILIAGSTEVLSWCLFPWSGVHSLEHDCIVRDDPSTGVRGVPNTTCWDKIAETAPIEYSLNNCGHRTGMKCGPKPPGTYRIVMVGSSFAMGMRVPEQQTIARLLPPELSTETRRKVELYNEGFAWGSPHTLDLRFNDVLSAKPDLILWILTPYDVRNPTLLFLDGFGPTKVRAAITRGSPRRITFIAYAWNSVRAGFAKKSFLDALREQWDQTRTSFMLRHYLYESEALYVNSYLENNGQSVFLKTHPDAAWLNRIKEFDGVAADIERRAATANVPLVAVLVPVRAQAAMISMGHWPPGYDPYKLNDDLRAIITSHGGTYVDILPGFRTVPNAGKYFLPVDGHPTAQGHAIISLPLAKELTSGAVPALRAANPSQALLGRFQ
jgi:hypothetical protein